MLVKWLIILVTVYLLLMLAMYLLQRRMVYFPAGDPGKPPSGFSAVQALTSDGLELQGLYMRTGENPQRAVICLHGNGGNRHSFIDDMRLYMAGNYHVFSFDWRGYGGNPGSPSEQGLYLDGEAMLKKVMAVTGLASGKIILHGRSLGCAIAIEMARRHQVDRIVLLSPFVSLGATAATHYPWLPVNWLLKDRYDSFSKAPEIEESTLVITGSSDRLIPPGESEKLARALPRGRFHLVPGVGHNSLLMGNMGSIQRLVGEFLEP